MKPLLKKKNIVHILIVIISVVCAIVFTYLFSHRAIGEITITAQEECNPASSNNQVRLKSVIGGSGTIYDLSPLASETGWEYDEESGQLGYYGGVDRTVVLNCSGDSKIDLHFQKQSSSGIIIIEGKNIKTICIDLYDSEWTYYDKTIKGKLEFELIPVWFGIFAILLELLKFGIGYIHKLNNKILSLGVLLVFFELCFALLFFCMYPEKRITLDSTEVEHIRYKGFELTESGWLSTEGDPYIVVDFDKALRVKSVHISMEYMSEQDSWGQIFVLDSYEKDSLSFCVGDNKVVFPVHFKDKYLATGVRLDVVSKAGATVQPTVVTINSYRDILMTTTKYAVILWSIFAIAHIISAAFHKLSHDQKHKLLLNILIVFNPVVVIWAVEHLDGSALSLDKVALLGTYLTLVASELIILTITRRIYVSIIITDLICMIIGLVNYYVTLFRGVPFSFSDIFSINTALDVVGEYQFRITLYVVLSVLAVVAMIVSSIIYSVVFKDCKIRLKFYHSAIIVAISIASIGGVFKFVDVNDLTNTLAVDNKYNDSGVVLGVLSSVHRIEKPKGYSAQKAKDILSELSDEQGEQEGQTPNIIVIMNESFADLNILGDFETNEEVIPYFNSLSDNVIKGYCGVSVFGGGTCNSEYEVLTGNSMVFFPSDSYPYNQYCKENVLGMASYLGDLGYYCIAEHPAPGGNYNRESVYKKMGFDETIFETDFSGSDIVRYVSDWSTYEKVLNKISEVDEPLFMLDITMQNHGGYGTSTEWDSPIELVGMDYPNTEEYMSSVHVSDQALQMLLEELQICEEPTYVLFFGDHLPSTADGFVDNMLELSGNDARMKYFTPFVIWSNVEMQSQVDVITSTNYLGGMIMKAAGLQMPEYFVYLTEVQKQLPVITTMGYQDVEGNWYLWDQESDYTDLIQDYSIVQYYYFKQK